MAALRAALLATSLLLASPSAAQAPAGAAPPQSSAAAAPPQSSTAAAPAPPTSAATPAKAPAATQEPTVTRFGFGAGIGTGTSGAVPVLYLPIDVGPVRMELDGAYAKVGTSEVNATTSRIGFGLFGLLPIEPGIRFPLGARFQYARDDVAGASAEAIRIAAALGGEWAPVPSVSFGVEGQVGYSAGLGNAVSGLDVSAQAILRVFVSTTKSSGSAAASAPGPKRPKKCERSSDCERPDICFDGYCRH